MNKISTAKEALELSIQNGYDLEIVRKAREDNAWDQVMELITKAAKKGHVCAYVGFRDDHKKVYMRLIDAGFDPTKLDYVNEGDIYYKGIIYWAKDK